MVHTGPLHGCYLTGGAHAHTASDQNSAGAGEGPPDGNGRLNESSSQRNRGTRSIEPNQCIESEDRHRPTQTRRGFQPEASQNTPPSHEVNDAEYPTSLSYDGDQAVSWEAAPTPI